MIHARFELLDYGLLLLIDAVDKKYYDDKLYGLFPEMKVEVMGTSMI